MVSEALVMGSKNNHLLAYISSRSINVTYKGKLCCAHKSNPKGFSCEMWDNTMQLFLYKKIIK